MFPYSHFSILVESLPFVAAPGQLSTCQIMKERISQKIIEKQDFCILGKTL